MGRGWLRDGRPRLALYARVTRLLVSWRGKALTPEILSDRRDVHRRCHPREVQP
ncbi:MAG TPA: hypothetical protein VGO93_24115 [Candidatus Xenobia bacterium]